MKITKDNIKDIYKAKKRNAIVIESQGFSEIETFFCDSSGIGLDSEPALTSQQLETKIHKILEKESTIHTWIVASHQFQVYIGVYKKEKGKIKTSKKIANNTYLIDGKKIMLHDTIILEQKGQEIIINTGGWNTRTTHNRINKYLPVNMYVYSKDFTSMISIDGEESELIDGMKVKGKLDIN